MRCYALRWFVVLALAAVAAAASAADRPDVPESYAWRWPLAPSAAALQRVALPPAVYDGAAHPDLRDLRVFNAAHEVVPYAFVAQALPVAPPHLDALRLYPLEVDRAHPSIDDVTVRVTRSVGGTTIEMGPAGQRHAVDARLAAYVVDASALEAPVAALIVVPEGNGSVDARLRIEASDDLVAWQVVAPAATLLRLVVGERTLGRDRLPIVAQKARYFRLSSADSRPLPTLASVSAETGAAVAEPRTDWREVNGTIDQDGVKAFVYDTGTPLPATRLKLDLPASNSVVPIVVEARARAQDPWRAVASGVVYRMGDAAAELRSEPLALAGTPLRYFRVVPDERAGVTAAPRLALGWTTPEILFAARGSAPYELAYGRLDAAAGALPLGTLVPRTTGRPLVDEAIAVAPVAAPLHGDDAALRPRLPLARIALWATLAIAALLLVALAVRLLRQVQSNDPPSGGTPPP